MNERQLGGRVAIVTGGSRGIGRAVALRFAVAGAAVVVAARGREAAQTVADEIVTDGGRAIAVGVDVAEPDLVQAMVDRTIEAFGRIDILVNNAGVHPKRKSVLDLPVEEWDEIVRVNLRGTFLCSKAVLPAMQRQAYGRIVNVASRQADRPGLNTSAYAASKAGIMALTKALAQEVSGANINVVAFAPGPIDTVLLRGAQTAEELANLANRPPSRRLGLPEDLVEYIAFIASEAARPVTGAVHTLIG